VEKELPYSVTGSPGICALYEKFLQIHRRKPMQGKEKVVCKNCPDTLVGMHFIE
jgi:hypothetical protein